MTQKRASRPSWMFVAYNGERTHHRIKVDDIRQNIKFLALRMQIFFIMENHRVTIPDVLLGAYRFTKQTESAPCSRHAACIYKNKLHTKLLLDCKSWIVLDSDCAAVSYLKSGRWVCGIVLKNAWHQSYFQTALSCQKVWGTGSIYATLLQSLFADA